MPGFSSLLGCFIGSFLIIFFLIARFAFKVFHFVHQAKNAAQPHFDRAEEAANDSNANNNQYKKNKNDQDDNGNPRGRYYQNSNHNANGKEETIIDHRDPSKAKKKIFTDNEGEYVDFEEER